jgi:acetyltransferase-like isoleucine patch superfamily enzyme
MIEIIKFLALVLKKLILNSVNYFRVVFREVEYSVSNKTCHIYPGVFLYDSKIANYNVLFENVSMVSSTIGDHTYIQKNSKIYNANIGKFCSIASNVTIGPGIHNIISVSTHPAFYLFNTPLVIKFPNCDLFDLKKNITIIENDVWIGENAIIMDGVKVGTGAIVAAGAIVTKDIPPYTICGGIPAKIIRNRFSEDEINYLLESKWWDWPLDIIKCNHLSFQTVELFKKIRYK